MSLIDDQIKEELRKFSEQHGPVAIEPAKVIGLNDDDTIKVQFGDDSIIEDVRLKAIVAGGNKVLLIPKQDSIVQVGKIGNSDEYVVLSVHEISEVVYIIGGVKFSVTNEGFLIKKGDDTLRDALVTFVEAVEKIIVIEGRNPDRVKLTEAKNKFKNILR